MPRVLIVTYQWLPMFNVGVKHVATLCRYLPQAGWEPHILTKDWSEGPAPEDAPWGMSWEPTAQSSALELAEALPVTRTTSHRRDNRWLRWHDRLVSTEMAARAWTATGLARRALQYTYPFYGNVPDLHRGWAEQSVTVGLATVRQYGIGAVVSVCPAPSAHILGGEIARRAGIPWVAMFDTLHTFDHGIGDGRSRRERWGSRLQTRHWLRGASRSACVSPRMSDFVRDEYGVAGDVITVSYDPDERRVAPHRVPGSPMRVTHTGTLDPARQDVEPLLAALDALVAATTTDGALSERLVVDLVGSQCEDHLAELLRGRPCEALVTLRARVSPAEAVRLQRESDVLLAFNRAPGALAERAASPGYPAKMFEHWNAQRPTISIGTEHDGYAAALWRESGGGAVAEDAAAVQGLLQHFLDELHRDGKIAFNGDETTIARHAAPEQARRLGALLDQASAERFGSWQRARR